MNPEFTHKEVAVSHSAPERGDAKENAAHDILAGLSARPRSIPSKYFYDARGSQLFEQITALEAYYPSRTEKAILRAHADEIMTSGRFQSIVELGSGDCSKISILLESAVRQKARLHYIPVDVSTSAIQDSCRLIAARFPDVTTDPLVGDFMEALDWIDAPTPRLVCFFGSTIGNLTRPQADDFLARIGTALRPSEHFLLGLDMVKDPKTLEQAYNDSEGVTEAFNKNILVVANHLAGTNFDPDKFSHRAFFDEDEARVEMQLTADEDMVITAPGLSSPLFLARGETIHTEYSHKFTQAHIKGFAARGGLDLRRAYSDTNGWFTVADYAKPGPS